MTTTLATLAPLQTYKEWFEDLRCDEADLPPRHLQAHLTALGGKTIYGKPAFRMVRSETVGRKLAIDFPIWAETADPHHVIPIKEAVDMMNERTLSGERKHSAEEVHEFVTQTADANARPLRSDSGYRWVNKYAFTGIVIEKWNPPDLYGPPVEWEAKKILGFSFCGPYPHEGDYEIIGGEQEEEDQLEIVNVFGKPFTVPRKQRIPWHSKDRVTQLLQHYHKNLTTQPENHLTRTMLRVAEFQQRELARYQRLQKYFDPIVKDVKDIFDSVSLEAGRIREDMVRQCRMLNHGKGMGHVGA